MQLEYYIKRNRTDIKTFCERLNIDSYDALCIHCKKHGMIMPKKEELNYEFKKDVEERTAAESSNKKRRVSNKKSIKSKSNDSISTGRSKSAQRVRKSPAKRQRKRVSDKVEPIQPVGRSESSK